MKKKIIYGLLFAVALVTASSSFVSCKDYEGDDVARLQEQNAQLDADLRTFVANQIAAIKQCSCDPTLAGRLATVESTYAKLTDLAGYLTEHQSLDGYVKTADLAAYAKTSDIPSLEGYLQSSDLTDYAKTETIQGWVQDQFVAMVQSNSEKIAEILGTSSVTPDLSQYATKEDLANLRNYIIMGDSMVTAYTLAKASFERLPYISDSLKTAYDRIKVLADSIANADKQITINRDSIAILADSIDQVAADALANFIEAKKLAQKADSLAQVALDSIGKVDAKVADLQKAMDEADKKLQEQIDTLKKHVEKNEKDIENIKKFLKQEVTGIEIQGTYNPVFGYFALPVGVQSNVLATYYGNFDAAVEFPLGDEEKGAWVGGVAKATASEIPAVKGGKFSAQSGIVMNEEEGNAGNIYLTINPSNVDFDGANVKLYTSDNKDSYVTLSDLTASATQLKWGATRGSANGFYQAKATIAKENVTKTSLKFDLNSAKAAAKEVVNNWRTPSNIDKSKLLDAVYKNLNQDLPRLGVQYNWEDVITGKQKIYASKYDVAAVSVKPFGFDLFYDKKDIFSKYVTKVQNKVNGKIHNVENELKDELRFNLGLGNLPDHIDIQINIDEADKKMDVAVTAEGTLPKQVTIDGVEELVNKIKNTTPTASVGEVKIQYFYKTRTWISAENKWSEWGTQVGPVNELPESDSQTLLQVTGMQVVKPEVTINYNISTDVNIDVDHYNAGDTIATATVDLSKFINNITSSIENSVAPLNDVLKAVSGLQGNIDSKMKSIYNTIDGYLNRAESLSNRVFGFASDLLYNPNRFFQPALFVSNGAKTANASSAYEIPTQVEAGGEYAFFLTTGTMEIGVPAFKKYIAATRVYDAKGNEIAGAADAINAQANVNEVLNGSDFNVSNAIYVNMPSQSGATVEMIYEVLGYNGKVAGKKFYIQVK